MISNKSIPKKQKLREFLIRQKMQRNSRQEKEAAAASAAVQVWPGGDMAAYQQDKSQRPPPPYPQVHHNNNRANDFPFQKNAFSVSHLVNSVFFPFQLILFTLRYIDGLK